MPKHTIDASVLVAMEPLVRQLAAYGSRMAVLTERPDAATLVERLCGLKYACVFTCLESCLTDIKPFDLDTEVANSAAVKAYNDLMNMMDPTPTTIPTPPRNLCSEAFSAPARYSSPA